MIQHENPGMNDPTAIDNYFPQQLDKRPPVVIVAIDLATFITTTRYVPQGTSRIETRLSRQVCEKRRERQSRSREVGVQS